MSINIFSYETFSKFAFEVKQNTYCKGNNVDCRQKRPELISQVYDAEHFHELKARNEPSKETYNDYG